MPVVLTLNLNTADNSKSNKGITPFFQRLHLSRNNRWGWMFAYH